MARPIGRNGQAVRHATAALLATLLGACSDGYPTEDVPQIDPARMNQAQLLSALNALGKEPHLGKRWRYALHDECELEVAVNKSDVDRRRVVLEGAVVSTRSVDGVSEIRLVPKSGGETLAVTALETRRWSDTVRARSLLTHLGVIVFFLQIDTLTQKNSNGDKHLQNWLSRTACAFGAN